ncbi:MAG: hypothetical protein HWQ42_08660 [Nostoc sp. JL23]|nr:hypothetical protein [Nostoc sp. JL23]
MHILRGSLVIFGRLHLILHSEQERSPSQHHHFTSEQERSGLEQEYYH